MNQNSPTSGNEMVSNQTIAPVAAQLTDFKPNQAQRRAAFTHLGTIKFDEGSFQAWANKKDGSLLIITPDRQHYLIDTNVAVNQIYKYWKAFREGAVQEVDNPKMPTDDALPGIV